jgi:hypothetical protein
MRHETQQRQRLKDDEFTAVPKPTGPIIHRGGAGGNPLQDRSACTVYCAQRGRRLPLRDGVITQVALKAAQLEEQARDGFDSAPGSGGGVKLPLDHVQCELADLHNLMARAWEEFLGRRGDGQEA